MRGKNIKKSPDQKKSDRGGQRQELSPSVLRRRMIGIRRRRYCRSIPLSLSQPDTTTIRQNAMFHIKQKQYADRYFSHSQKHQSKDFGVYCTSEVLLLFDIMPNSGPHAARLFAHRWQTLKNGGDGDINLVEFSC